jgi:urease accessory protein UreE
LITCLGWGLRHKHKTQPHGLVVVVPLEKGVGGNGGGVLVVDGELVVVVKAAIQ